MEMTPEGDDLFLALVAFNLQRCRQGCRPRAIAPTTTNSTLGAACFFIGRWMKGERSSTRSLSSIMDVTLWGRASGDAATRGSRLSHSHLGARFIRFGQAASSSHELRS